MTVTRNNTAVTVPHYMVQPYINTVNNTGTAREDRLVEDTYQDKHSLHTVHPQGASKIAK